MEPTIHAPQLTKNERDKLVRVARQLLLKPSTQHAVVVKTASNIIPTIETEHFSATCRLLADTLGVMNVLPDRNYIHVSNFSREEERSRKHMMISETTDPLTVIYAICREPRRGF